MRKCFDIPYGPLETQKIDLWLPQAETFDLYVHMHGGGLETGDRRCQEAFPRYLTQRGVGLASVEYRLLPEAAYPAFIEDAAAAAAWVKRNIHAYGRVRRLFVGGSSAGGYLSMMLCFDRRWLAAHGLSPLDFDGFFHDAGQPTAHYNVLKSRGFDPLRVIVDASAPLYHVGEDPQYPPMHFVVSDNDMPNRLEQTRLMLSALKNFGYDMTKLTLELCHGEHTQYYDRLTPEGESVYGEMVCRALEKMSAPS